MDKAEEEAYVGFSYFLGIGPTRFACIRNKFNTFREAYMAPYNTLANILGSQIARKFAAFRNDFNPAAEIRRLHEQNTHILYQQDPSFPLRIREISDPPICLFAKGDSAVLTKKKLF